MWLQNPFSVSSVIIPMTSNGSKSQGLRLAVHVTVAFLPPPLSFLCYIQHKPTKVKKWGFFLLKWKDWGKGNGGARFKMIIILWQHTEWCSCFLWAWACWRDCRVGEDFHMPEGALPAHRTMCSSLGCPKNWCCVAACV